MYTVQLIINDKLTLSPIVVTIDISLLDDIYDCNVNIHYQNSLVSGQVEVFECQNLKYIRTKKVMTDKQHMHIYMN